MIRRLYSLFMTLAQPLLRRKLARRGVSEPGYLEAVPERFGHYTQPAGSGWLWLHAVSLGETRAAAILIHELRRQRPDLRLLLTHGTATGREEGRKLLRSGDVQVWQPWDSAAAVERFLTHFQPALGLLMETEVWPNLVAACARGGVPLMLVNARLSDQSLHQALRLAWLARPAYGALKAVLAQTSADAARLRQLGAPQPQVFGNIKFDAAVDAARLATGRRWRAGMKRPVIMLASSREGEEALWLQQVLLQRAQLPELQWLVVPRHPQRFDEVAGMVRAAGLSVSQRSQWGDEPQAADVWVGDTLGDMALYYGLSDLAWLGGSFAPLGGQNLIEAAACGCPLLMGPHTFNFADAAEQSLAEGASWRVADMGEAMTQSLRLLSDVRALEGSREACERFLAAHRGAVHRTVDFLLTRF